MAIRTLLYTPGNDARKVSKVGTFGADAAILDLEDAVAVDQKVAAREAVRLAIPTVKGTGTRVYVRVNPTGEKTDFSLSPNPPKDTDGRREGSGRGWVRELQGRWPGLLG